MKVRLSHYGQTVEISVPHDDVTLSELVALFRALALAAGYAENQVDEALGTD